MTLDCISSLKSRSEDIENVKYAFIAFIPELTLNWSSRTYSGTIHKSDISF